MRNETVLQWKLPPCGKQKLNFDAALFHDINFAGVGVILRNEVGEVVFALSRKEIGVSAVDGIEALAFFRGLQMLLNMGCNGLIIEGDSMHVIDDIKSREPRFTSQVPIIKEIQQILRHLSDWELSHVGRWGNEAAHFASKTCLYGG
ncbi:uncharacterized protein LOC122274657 [Carya illinoinensis]|uniref:uncharacterized protein LOC122274657 n=1 Tax=Carya illinoinensis TaxID=32201 RepID=UPI001C722839|nr:uncharacterized protein LOC122274657 [Carya illinoinensis]